MIKLTLDSWDAVGKAYGAGVLFAGHQFIQANPDWYDRLREGLYYAVAWPYSIFKGMTRVT